MMNTPKRIFVGLLLLSLFTILALIILGWLLAVHRVNLLNQFFLILGGAVILLLGALAFGLLSLIVNLWSAKANPSMENLMLAAVNMLFPIALGLGKIFNIDQDRIKRSFIAVNNELVRNRKLMFKSEEIMILAPHCLQWSQCQYKITVDVENCRRCGKCVINDLHNLKDKYGVKLAVASGGTLARKFVKDLRPKGIVAIACERDLTSGIQEINPMPVLGVLNLRPQGPCFNTDVYIDQVEEALICLIQNQNLAEQSFSLDIPHRGLQGRPYQIK
ncbi:DUF116 domain-containing protein [Zhaonella formicivorans]|uniref:DUF116 domain-containing protein n=1 Tax=Zhaonella formicivorans TaxID=2528593 RepID=UPI001D107FB8|nr:DUF116 domain-containing protein [Zhaonella formicivorans]